MFEIMYILTHFLCSHHIYSYGTHSGEKKENGPCDLEKRDGLGWEVKEALEREANMLEGNKADKQGTRVLRFGGNTPLISGMGASEVEILLFTLCSLREIVYRASRQ